MPYKNLEDKRLNELEWRNKNREQVREYQRGYAAKNPDIIENLRTKWQGIWAERTEQGFCSNCHKEKAENGFKTCSRCRERDSNNRKIRKEKGLCDCGNPLEGGQKACSTCRAKRQRTQNRRRKRLRERVLEAYGGKCACPNCPEVNPAFLTVDHIYNDGAEHRKQWNGSNKIYQWLVTNNFPKTGFRLLCYNCNCGRAANGGICPHEQMVQNNDWLAD